MNKLGITVSRACGMFRQRNLYDMVVCDPETLTCKIYEIKHSDKAVASQYRQLIDEKKCAKTEHEFGKITGRYVIYRGEPFSENGIEYLNVENYLRFT